MLKQQDKPNQHIFRSYSILNDYPSLKTSRGLLLIVLLLFFKVNSIAQDENERVDEFAMDIYNSFQKSDKAAMFELFWTHDESTEVFRKQGYSVSDKSSHINSSDAHRRQIDVLFEDCREMKIVPANSVYVEHTMFLEEKSGVQTANLLIKAQCGLIEFTLRVFDCVKAKGRWAIVRAPNLKRVHDADSSFNDFPLILIDVLRNQDKSAYKALKPEISSLKVILMESTYKEYEKTWLLERIQEDSITGKVGSDYDSLITIFSYHNFDLKNATVKVDESDKFTEKGVERGRFSCLLTYNNKTCRIKSEIDCIKTPEGWKIIGMPEVYF